MYDCVEGSTCRRQNEFWWECVPDVPVSPQPMYPCTPLQLVAEQRGDLSQFFDALNTTGFLPLLLNVHSSSTMFAPNNGAFAKLGDKLGNDADKLAKVRCHGKRRGWRGVPRCAAAATGQRCRPCCTYACAS